MICVAGISENLQKLPRMSRSVPETAQISRFVLVANSGGGCNGGDNGGGGGDECGILPKEPLTLSGSFWQRFGIEIGIKLGRRYWR